LEFNGLLTLSRRVSLNLYTTEFQMKKKRKYFG